jgi:ubiquinone/menaquinone biosynthesis C-methylase UbiE
VPDSPTPAPFACPVCRGLLAWLSDRERCTQCGRSYESRAGIPILLADVVGHKQQQAQFFDDADAEFEIERPAQTPRFYRSQIEAKFTRSVTAIRSLVRGATALNVCGGSGMDAEFLARLGAHVVVADISLGAAQRALERARRHDFELAAVVADAERLPFPDRSVDLVYVHDGLHHLEDPLVGLAEMARVARVAVSVNEPARAAATRLAVRLRLSEEREEAGNEVARVDPDAITSTLETMGFAIVRKQRYAMVYRHEPGGASTVLSAPPLFQIASGAVGAFNAALGGLGNKLTVQAVRRDTD